MKYRKLRIAWSVAWGVLGLLPVAGCVVGGVIGGLILC
jgi:hypothetical protein